MQRCLFFKYGHIQFRTVRYGHADGINTVEIMYMNAFECTLYNFDQLCVNRLGLTRFLRPNCLSFMRITKSGRDFTSNVEEITWTPFLEPGLKKIYC